MEVLFERIETLYLPVIDVEKSGKWYAIRMESSCILGVFILNKPQPQWGAVWI
jgi:hypothetical protein